MRPIYAVVLCFTLLSCGKTKESATEIDSTKSVNDSIKRTDSDNNAQFELENYLTSEQADTSKVQIINDDCAVMILLTEDEIEVMKKSGSEEDFETTMDDANFYSYQASKIIDSVGVKTVMSKKQFIKFVGDQKSWTIDTRKKDLAFWNLILFNTSKSPQVAPTISVTMDVAKNYFDKK